MIFGDLVPAGRLRRDSPVFAITTAITIGIAIAASAVVFRVVNAVLLPPLPYGDPERLVIVCHDMIKRAAKLP